jgi:Flp pilus assembly protein TadG
MNRCLEIARGLKGSRASVENRGERNKAAGVVQAHQSARAKSSRAFGGRSERGQAMLEYAIVAPIFFFLICGVMDFSRMFFAQMTLQDAVLEAGRYASTGNHLADPNNPQNNLSRVASIDAIAQQYSFCFDFSNIQVSSVNGGAGSAGGPGDTVTVSLTTNLKLMTPMIGRLFPNGAYTFTSTVSFKNEPFPTSETN